MASLVCKEKKVYFLKIVIIISRNIRTFKFNMKNYILLIIAPLLIFCSRHKHSVDQGDEAPVFSTTDYSGATLSLESLRGKRILLHFWADWCSECRAEFPKLESVYQDLKDKNFEIIAVNVGQSQDHVTSFVKEYKLTFPMLVDEQSVIAKQYGIRGLPTNFFINPDLTVHKMIIGWVDEKQVLQNINEM
jgi:peroxiredoxin